MDATRQPNRHTKWIGLSFPQTKGRERKQAHTGGANHTPPQKRGSHKQSPKHSTPTGEKKGSHQRNRTHSPTTGVTEFEQTEPKGPKEERGAKRAHPFQGHTHKRTAWPPNLSPKITQNVLKQNKSCVGRDGVMDERDTCGRCAEDKMFILFFLLETQLVERGSLSAKEE